MPEPLQPKASSLKSLQNIAVVGGGLSGLAAAHRLVELGHSLASSPPITLYEASPRLGGVMGTKRIGDYLVETGADSFITNKPWAVELCQRLGIADRLIPTEKKYRRSLVLRKGKPVAVPDGFQLLSPARIWPVLKSPLFSLRGKLRMGMEYLIPRRETDEEESLADFVRRRFGQEALERLVQPLVGGIYTSDPEKLSLKATMPRFLEMEREHRSLIRASRRKTLGQKKLEDHNASGARYGLFTTPRNGISGLLNALAEAIRQKVDVVLGASVRSLHREPDGTWQLEFRGAEPKSFDAVILAIPAYRASELLSDTDGELSQTLSEIEYASSAIVVTGHKLSDIEHPLDAFGLVIPAIERRRILAVSFTSRKFAGRAPEGCVELRTFVGGAMQPEELDRDDDELQDVVLAELRDLLGVQGEPDFVHVARWNNSMPQYHLGHLDRVEQIETRIETHPGLALAGNAYRGVGIPDCIHSGEQAAERLIADLHQLPKA